MLFRLFILHLTLLIKDSFKGKITMIQYRKATDKDFELALQIKSRSIKIYIDKIWGWDDTVQLEYHRNDFNPATLQIILDNEGHEIGLLDVREDDDLIYIKSILIDHSAQGKGIGTQILTKIIQQSAESNKKIELQVYKINEKARKLYERLGFKIIGQTELHYQMAYN